MDDVSHRNFEYEPLTEYDDTMMQHVVDYYKEYGTNNELMEAYYLLGSVYRDLHEAPRALEAFLNGENAADTTDNDCRYDLLARLLAQKSDILYSQSLYELAIKTDRLVYEYAVQAKDTLFMLAAQWGRLGKCFSICDYQTIADECWDLLEESKQMGLYGYGASRLCTSVLANMELGRVEDAAALLAIYEQHSGQVDTETNNCLFPIYYSAKGRVLAATGHLDSAEYFYRKELEEQDWNNRQEAYRGLRMVFEKKGLTDSVCKYAPLQCEAVDSSYQEMLSQNLQNLHELYNYSRLQTENNQKGLLLQASRRKTMLSRCTLALVTISGLFLFFYLRSRYKQKIVCAELKLERANIELEEREAGLQALQNELAMVKDGKEKLRLTQEVEKAERETEEQRKIIISDQKKLDEMRLWVRTKQRDSRQKYCTTPLFQSLLYKARTGGIATENDYELVQQALLEKDAGLLHRVYVLLVNPSETELHTTLLLRFGMTKTEVSFLTAHSQAAVTNICTRLFFKVHGHKCTTSAEAYKWLLNL